MLEPSNTPTLPASASVPSPGPRPPLAVLMMLHAFFYAVQTHFERVAGPGLVLQLDNMIALGHLGVARAIVEKLLPPEGSDQHPDRVVTAAEAAAVGLVNAINTALTLAPLEQHSRRRFFARVSLLGHTNLGVCHVAEERLAGAEVLLCQQLEEEGRPCHWIRMASVYRLEELETHVARRAELDADARRARERAEKARLEQVRAERAAKLRERRENSDVVLRREARHESDSLAVISTPGALSLAHDDVDEALRELPPWDFNTHHNAQREQDGFWIDYVEGREASIIAALTPLGFRSFIIETNDVDAGATNYFPTTDAAPSVAALVSSLAMQRRAEGPVFIKRWPDHERVCVWSDSVGALNRSHADLDALLTSAGVSNWQINDNRNNYGQLVGIWLEDGTKHYDALRDGLKAFGFADVVELTGKASNEPDDDCEESEVL